MQDLRQLSLSHPPIKAALKALRFRTLSGVIVCLLFMGFGLVVLAGRYAPGAAEYLDREILQMSRDSVGIWFGYAFSAMGAIFVYFIIDNYRKLRQVMRINSVRHFTLDCLFAKARTATAIMRNCLRMSRASKLRGS